jgi:hypothetical protein
VGSLQLPVQHDSHLTVSHFVQKLDRYTTIAAGVRASRGEKISMLRLAFEPPAYFAYKYFWQRGFLDGAHGLILASLMGFYRLTELAKVRLAGTTGFAGSGRP